jgi:hypothetical protein
MVKMNVFTIPLFSLRSVGRQQVIRVSKLTTSMLLRLKKSYYLACGVFPGRYVDFDTCSVL